MTRLNYSVLIVLCTVVLGVSTSVGAQQKTPQPILDESGKEIGLFRRVVSRPGASVTEEPGEGKQVEAPRPFSTFHVFSERTLGARQYLEVGPPGRSPTGWIDTASVLEWPNNLTLVFNPPVTRFPVPFFRSLAALSKFRAAPGDISERGKELAQKIQSGSISSFSGVLAAESEQFVDWKEKFYLMPVLSFEKTKGKRKRGEGLLLKTTAIPLVNQGAASACTKKPNLGIVFVIDTTRSMGPYIDRTVEMVEKLSQKIIANSLSDRVSFGLVGFRDDPAGREGVEYRSRVFQALDPSIDPAQFSSVLRKTTAATGSTRDFSEDGLAGLLDAVNMDWEPFQGRWVIFITDASPRETTKDSAGAQHDIDSVAADLWEADRIGLMSVHLQTPEAKKANDIPKATRSLKRLSSWRNVATPYFAVEDGDLGSFGSLIEDVTEKVLLQINKEIADLKSDATGSDPLADIGLAQRVMWLGKCNNDDAPDIIEGWVMQRAIHPPGTSKQNASSQVDALEPRILLTRQQLSQFTESISLILEAAKSAPDKGGDAFFDAIANQLANASIDPSKLSASGKTYQSVNDWVNQEVKEIGDLLPAYLSRIPFKPDFLTITRRTWDRMSPPAQKKIIDNLGRRISTLRSVYNNNKLWSALHPDSDPSEYVTPLLLKRLP